MKTVLLLVLSSFLSISCSTNALKTKRDIASESMLGSVSIVNNQKEVVEALKTFIQFDQSGLDEKLPFKSKLIQLISSEQSITENSKNTYYYTLANTPKEFHFYSCGHKVGCKSPAFNYSVRWPPTFKTAMSNNNDDDYLSWRTRAFAKRYKISKEEKKVVKRIIDALFRKQKNIRIKEKYLELTKDLFDYLSHPQLRVKF